jgi:hypothetical protein
MYTGLLHSHFYLRWIVLILLVVVIVTSLIGWLNKKAYTNTDNKLSLYLFIATHVQLLLGLILYTQSGWVQFGKLALKVKEVRYWTMEHGTIMLLAIVLITMARITAKKMSSSEAKHKRMFIVNLIALIIILIGIEMSGRGFNF